MCKVKPFIKWAGGKGQFTKKLIPLIPEYKRYIEPFIGGGAMLFAIQPKKFIANDLNYELITSYKTLQELKYDEVLKQIDKYGKKHTEDNYKKVRVIDYKNVLDEIGITARFIYLNKGGFNGLYRVNGKGEFNVPWNKKPDTNFYDRESIIETSKYLNESRGKFYNEDYMKILNLSKEGDFLFVDPPYDNSPDSKSKTFDSYQKGGFGEEEQIKLADKLNELTDKGVKWILCNYDTPLIKKLYKGNKKLLLEAHRPMSVDSSKRKGTYKEVFYYNYDK